MFENIKNIFKKAKKKELLKNNSKDKAKERLHLVLMQDRANVSADFLDLMRKEIIEVIKKYIDIDEEAMDVRLTNETNDDGAKGAPALYANIPIINIKDETRKLSKTNQEKKLNIVSSKNEQDLISNNKENNIENEKDNIEEQNEDKIELSNEETNIDENSKIEKNAEKEEKEENSTVNKDEIGNNDIDKNNKLNKEMKNEE